MNKYRELFEKYVAEVGRAPHALTRVWVLGFCDWLALNESGLTKRAADICPRCEGVGQYVDYIGKRVCSLCDGTGKCR